MSGEWVSLTTHYSPLPQSVPLPVFGEARCGSGDCFRLRQPAALPKQTAVKKILFEKGWLWLLLLQAAAGDAKRRLGPTRGPSLFPRPDFNQADDGSLL